MESVEEAINKAIAAKDIPGAVLAASSTDGTFKYAKAFGLRTLKDDGNGPQSMGLDTLFWMGSCTKLLTSISVLQCVEKGYFTLDEDVTRLLPELKDIEVQIPAKMEDGVETPPRRVKAKNVITLRHLLLHTSGLSYTKFGDLSLSLMERCLAPLAFEPGEGFIYGTGVDFAGFMVERVTGMSLESYIHKHVCAPLGITSVCFRPREHPDLHSRLADVSLRKEKGGPVEHTPLTIWPPDTEGDSGGSGAYATVADFQRVLRSVAGDDGVLLPSRMVDELLRPDMTPSARAGAMKALRNESTNNIYGGLPMGTEVAYAIGGMVVLEDLLPGRRPRGAVHWGGLLNVFFWMDRENGLSGIYGSQVFPAGDVKCLGLLAEFERGVYEAFYNSKNT
ncbi:hypothetical protein N3K66_007009 [Trichothecium roseum]|uniref:Uncharacterized protein n=1 Tax=Trichothecium roseum TaxID=47278 RepID=A0ACC0UX57_9HYPO|nr:hypothetical protein N3K66_007009 [Trichothecium roseum]